MSDDQLLRVKDVAAIMQCCQRQIWRLVELGKLPGPFRPSPRMPRWRRIDIEKYIESLAKKN